MSITFEYVVAAILSVSCQNNPSCFWVEPGTRYESLSPTQNPNWCVINRSNKRAPVKMEFIGYRMHIGPGIEPCDERRRAPSS